MSIRIKLSNEFPDWPFLRQTPGSKGIWGDCQFFVNDDTSECDYWFVYGDVAAEQTAICAPENVVNICAEPPTIERLEPKYLAQFGAVVSCHSNVVHRNHILSYQALPWMAGIKYVASEKRWDARGAMTYDDFADAHPRKDKLISVISSDKTNTLGHAARVEFVGMLKAEFGDHIDVFGRGVRTFADKWDVLAPYRYHVVLENTSCPDYWTEKLSDAILAETYPFYHGCTNFGEYFDGDSMTVLDLSDPKKAVALIKQVVQSDLDRETAQVRAKAKRDVLNRYNMFAFMCDLRERLGSESARKRITIRPKSQFVPLQSRIAVLSRKIGKQAASALARI